VCGIAPPSASPEIATASRRGRMPVHQMTVPTPPRSSRSAPGASRPMPSIGAHDGSLSASGASVPERSTCSSMARRSAARSRRRTGRARPRRRRSGHPPLPRPRAGRTGPPRGARASGATASARRRCPRPAVAARYPGGPGWSRGGRGVRLPPDPRRSNSRTARLPRQARLRRRPRRASGTWRCRAAANALRGHRRSRRAGAR
jgi:hypothetical protein